MLFIADYFVCIQFYPYLSVIKPEITGLVTSHHVGKGGIPLMILCYMLALLVVIPFDAVGPEMLFYVVIVVAYETACASSSTTVTSSTTSSASTTVTTVVVVSVVAIFIAVVAVFELSSLHDALPI